MAKLIFSCQNLTLVRAGNVLLDKANLEINYGEIVWLTGAGGVGKTSFAECLSGSLYVNGKINFMWNKESPYLAKVAYVSQFSQFKDKSGMSDFYYQQRFNSHDAEVTVTVEEELASLFANQQVKNNLLSLIDLFKFTSKLSSSLLYLSSGERKKLQLIKILANPTQLIILDNPFTGLDKLSVAKLENYITNLAKIGITIIIIDRLNYVFDKCQQIIVLADKKLSLINKVDYLTSIMPNNNVSEVLANEIKLKPCDNLIQYQEIVRFNNVSVTYGAKQILRNIDWLIKPGSKWLLEGENGAGKSTIISLINGDNPQAYANDICLFDKKRGSGETIWDIKSKIGYISPELQWNFARNLTCLEVVLTGYFDTPGLYARATVEQVNVAKDMLIKLNLDTYMQQNYSSLANGIQRSILLIRALIKNPPLLIFDEPCQGMSEEQSQFFVSLIDKLFNNSVHTIIYITHRADEVPKCLNWKLAIENGQVIKNQEIKNEI